MPRLTREVFQELAGLRLQEARALLDAGSPDGAYYLAGYAVECALKACIGKKTHQHDFPPPWKEVKEGYYTHELTKLLKTAQLERELDEQSKTRPVLAANWNTVTHWKEHARYERIDTAKARELHDAITDSQDGVLTWLQQHW